MDSSLNYTIGTYVILNIPDQTERVIGKIEEIIFEGDEKVVRYNQYFFPEKTHSNFLLINFFSW